jgi:sulfonate transport system substrate-binding protein
MKKTMKPVTIILLAILFLLTATACGSGSGTDDQSSSGDQASSDEIPETTEDTDAPKQKLRIGLAQDANEPGGVFGVAIKKGFLDEELTKVGYEAEWLGFAAAGPAVNEALIGGSLDLAYYGNLPPVQLKAKGFDIRLLSFIDPSLYYTSLVAPDSPIESLKDVEGKKVLVGRGTIVDEYWSDVINAYGIDESKVEVVNDPANATQIFASGNADVYISIDTLKYLLAAKGIPFREIENNRVSHPEFASQTVLVGRGDFLDEHGDVAVAFLRAYIRGSDYAEAHPDEVPELAANSLTPKELVEAILADDGDDYIARQTGGITSDEIERLQRLPDFLASHGYIDESYDVKTLIDDTYWKQAYKEVKGEEYKP